MTDIIELSDVINGLKVFIKFLIKKWKITLSIILLSSIISYLFWTTLPDIYNAKATFIVEENNSKSGGLSGIASQFGFDVGSLMGGGGSGLFSGENIFEIINSRLIIEKVFLSRITNNSKRKLADLYIDINNYKKRDNVYKNINFYNIDENSTHTILQDSILNILYKDFLKNNIIVEKQNKKSSLISIQITSSNEKFSKLFAERVLSQTSDLYISIKTKNISKSIEKIQKKADSLQNSLNGIYERSYINLSRPQEATNRDKTVTYTLYGEVIKNLETLKISQINQTPAIQVLDIPRYPIDNNKTKSIYVILMGALIGFLLSLILVVILFFTKENQ